MDEKFITKPILRKSERMIGELRSAYSAEKGVNVNQAETISLAIENEHRRLFGERRNNEKTV